jgi:hypothetical protein
LRLSDRLAVASFRPAFPVRKGKFFSLDRDSGKSLLLLKEASLSLKCIMVYVEGDAR